MKDFDKINADQIVSIKGHLKLVNKTYKYRQPEKRGYLWWKYLAEEGFYVKMLGYFSNELILKTEKFCYIEGEFVYYRPHVEVVFSNGKRIEYFFSDEKHMDEFMENEKLKNVNWISVK